MRTYTSADYTFVTGRDRETGEFVAIVREFPSLSWISSISRAHAADGLRRLLSDVLDDIYEDGEQPPTPERLRVRSHELRDLQFA